VVLDTNVLVSGFAYPNGTPGKIVRAVLSGGLRAVLSRHIIDETTRVLPRFKQFEMNTAEARDLLERLVFGSDLVEPVPVNETDLRDAADQPVLGTLIGSGADYLITGDKDLLALAGKYPIVTPAEFWERHG
jgi:putative PIN family toxin of toxin-antitoxin system